MRLMYVGMFAALLAFAMLAGCTALNQQLGSSGTYIIKYVKSGSGAETTATGTKLDNGSYKLQDGSVVGGDTVITATLSGQAAVCDCKCDCCGKPDTPCVEPDPVERYLCSDGRVVANKGECGGTCNQTAVSKVHYCADGKQVDDPANCGGVLETIYTCVDGRTVGTPSECGCSATTTVACIPAVADKKFKCADGTVSATESGCGSGAATTYYICSDGRKVEKEADCSGGCSQPTYTAATYVNTQGAVRVVYECWSGAIVNSKGECPLYCERECSCPDYEKSVCGADGKTYRNYCYARCAGAVVAKEGDCTEYECINSGQTCPNPASTLTMLSSSLSNRTYCCPGYECLPQPGTSTLTMMSQAIFTCQPPTIDTCMKDGGKCGTNADCCDKVCTQGVCGNASTCGMEGTTCASYVTGATAINTCCQGLSCVNGICAKPCTSNGAGCSIDSQCCSGYCNPQTYMCDNRSTCREAGATCSSYTTAAMAGSNCCQGLTCMNNICTTPQVITWCMDSDAGSRENYTKGTTTWGNGSGLDQTGTDSCCGEACVKEWYCNDVPLGASREITCGVGYECTDGACVAKEPLECTYEYCKGSTFYTGCYFDTKSWTCKCSSTKCASGACNDKGTACMPEQTACPYEYCTNGVFYTGCAQGVTGGCTCQSQYACTSQRCNTAGTSCA